MKRVIVSIFLVLLMSYSSWAGRAVKVFLGSEGVLSLKLKFNTPVTVKFPYPISYVVPADSRVDVQAGNDFVILKVVDSTARNAVVSVVLNKGGKPYVIPIQAEIVKKGEIPLKILVSDRKEALEKVKVQASTLIKEAVKEASSVPVAELIASMIRNTEFPRYFKTPSGYTIVDAGGKLLKQFSKNNLLEARLLYEYRSPVRIGVVIRLVNKTPYPLQISEEDFVGPGVLAVSLSRRRLAPRPRTVREKLVGDYTAYLYVVMENDKWEK